MAHAVIISLYQNFSNVNYSFCCWALSTTRHQPRNDLRKTDKSAELLANPNIIVTTD